MAHKNGKPRREKFAKRVPELVPTRPLNPNEASTTKTGVVLRASSSSLYPHEHPFRFCLVRTFRYLAVPVNLVKLLKVLNREEV